MNRESSFFDWETGRVIVVATVGHIAANIDTIMARLIAILTVAILAIKLYRMLYKAAVTKPPKEDDED